MNIVLLEPEMPANTGNIGRTCVATNTRLHLIRPLGFKLNEKMLMRAGLDYWDKLDLTVYDDYRDFRERNPGFCIGKDPEQYAVGSDRDSGVSCRLYMATTKARKVYTEVRYRPDDYIMFGKESAGIPEELLLENQENCVRIPMWGDIRSLNLSNSVSIILYEALRQNGFEKMNLQGELHRLKWRE